jgi:sigma-B regulation protein RsbU (phosphoserine phosphatase)
MAGSSSLEARAEEWQELLRLAGDPRGHDRLLERLLGALAEKAGVPAAALYSSWESEIRLEVRVGEGSFPTRLTEEDPDDLDLVELPGAVLAFWGRASAVPADLQVLLVTALKVRQLRRLVKQQGFEANLRGVELQALYDVGLAIASTLNLDELAEEILLRAVSLLDARRGALYGVDDGRLVLERTIGGSAKETIDDIEQAVEALVDGTGPDVDVLPGAKYLLGTPIEIEGDRRGLLVVADKESRTGVGPFGDLDRRTLELFANQAVIALENARLHREALEKQRLEREMELAAEIQKRLLPTVVPEVSGYELLGWSRPAQQIGGDYYDLIALDDGALGLVVGDVSGKGMPAALMVSTVHSALRLLLDRLEVGPALLERLNRHIADTSAPNKFITFFMAEVDSRHGEVHFLNAGHNPAILMDTSGEVRELKTGGLPLGLLPEGSYEDGRFGMEPGDVLCIYSDGITEAISAADEEFGQERLVEVLREFRREPLQSIIAAIDRATADFARGMPQADDQTLLLLRRVAEAT